jgi:hypothetical protein
MNPVVPILVILAIAWVVYYQLKSRDALFFNRSTGDKFDRSKLVGVLLGLDDNELTELLTLYRKEFGTGPARYARRTYQKWKCGKVQPATQTYERFLVHLPKVMTYDLKCEVLRHFMEEFTPKDQYELNVNTDDWQTKLAPLIKQVTDKAYTAQLPVEVERKLHWLGEGDMIAAQDILRASQAEEGRIMVAMLRDEFASIEKLLAEEHLTPKVSHVLKFPYGTIKLNIQRK